MDRGPIDRSEPWRSRPDWARGRIDASGRGLLVGVLWVFAAVWCLITSPILFVVPREIDKGNRIALIGLLFPAAGLLLVVTALRATLHFRRYGPSTLILKTIPVTPGGRLLGTIETRSMPAPETGYRLRLTCARRTGSGGHSGSGDSILWREERRMNPLPETDPSTTRIPVSFSLPPEAHETTLDDASDRILWVLEAAAGMRGTDYRSEFELPVFKAAGAGAAEATAPIVDAATAETDPFAGYEQPEAPFIPGSDGSVRVGPSAAGGLEIIVGPLRNPGVSSGLLLFLALWAGAWIVLLYVQAPLLFPIVFGGFGLLLLALTLDLTLGTSRLVIEAGEARLTRGLLGVGPTLRLGCADLVDVRLAVGLQSGDRSGTPFYNLLLVDRFGGTFVAARYLRDKREAEWLAAEIKRNLPSAG